MAKETEFECADCGESWPECCMVTTTETPAMIIPDNRIMSKEISYTACVNCVAFWRVERAKRFRYFARERGN